MTRKAKIALEGAAHRELEGEDAKQQVILYNPRRCQRNMESWSSGFNLGIRT